MAEEKEELVEKTNENKEDKNVTKVEVSKPIQPVNNITKVDLTKTPVEKTEDVKDEPKENEVEEEVVVVNETKEEQTKTEEVKNVIEEVTNEIEEPLVEQDNISVETNNDLPEKLQKVADFMKETGGDLNDYVQLNRDISKLDDSEVLDEYYRSTKSHLSVEERSFLLEDSFGVDEEVDDDKTIKKKQIALKEQVAKAKAYMDGQKSKYYEDIKAGSRLTPEAKKAMDFFNRYNKENEKQKKLNEATKKTFKQRTDNVFNDNFKGFDYKVGDKKFRFNVKDVNKVKETQSNINNFVDKFVGEDKTNIEDAAGYHKSLFTAMNPDAIARHFYEQGKADAVKDQIAGDKNINLDPRQTHNETNVGGVKYRVLGNDANDFKFKIKRKK